MQLSPICRRPKKLVVIGGVFQLHFLMQVPNELVGGGYFGLNCMSISTTAGDAKFAAFLCRWQGYIGLEFQFLTPCCS